MSEVEISIIIGSTIAELRKSKGLTQENLAERFHTSKSTIAHYEQGVTIPSVEMMLKFSEFFQVNVDYLMGKSQSRILYEKMNEPLYKNMKLSDAVNLMSSLNKENRRYLYDTLRLLKGNHDKK